MRIGSMCSGYGGLDMGLQTVFGGQVAWHFEYEKAPSQVLDARFPGVPNHGDLTTTNWNDIEPVDWLTAGYPCQPFSTAGNRKGTDDARHIWPYIADAISVLRPRNILLENVAGHLSLGFGHVLGDLSSLGYDCRWGVVRAADAGAPHGRKRIFIVAYTNLRDDGQRQSGPVPRRFNGIGNDENLQSWSRGADQPDQIRSTTITPNTDSIGRQTPIRRTSETPTGQGGHAESRFGPYAAAIERWERILGRPAPKPVDHKNRLNPPFVEWMMGLPDGWVTDAGIPYTAQLRALGNGVVPQQAALAIRTLVGA